MGCKVQTAIAMFYRTNASQIACMYRFGASAEHMCMQGIANGAMFVICILYVAYHHLLQHHGGLGNVAYFEIQIIQNLEISEYFDSHI